MKTADPRDVLFASLFESHLRPLGFRRRGRNATRESGNGLRQKVELESSTWNTAARVQFGMNIQVRHPAFRRDPFSDQSSLEEGDLLLHLSLRQQADPPGHRWMLDVGTDHQMELQRAADALASVGVDLVHRMSDIVTIEALCAQFSPTGFFEARAWCLRVMGRHADSAEVIRTAVANAPHDGFRSHAARLLARHDV
jgi:hypothetical protein